MSGLERMRGDGERIYAWAVRGVPESVDEAEANRISEKIDPMNPPSHLVVTGPAGICTVVVAGLGRLLGTARIEQAVAAGDSINLTVNFKIGGDE